MSDRFQTLQYLEESTACVLRLARDTRLQMDVVQRIYKNNAAEHVAGLQALYTNLAAVESPHVERVLECGRDENGAFFTLTAAPRHGAALTELLRRGPVNAAEFEVLARQLLDALEALQDHGVVHGTLTAHHIRISGTAAAEWKVVVDGFGTGFEAKSTTEEDQVTAYRCAAPEQWQGGTARRRTDIYALGCVLYEALAARPAFESRSLKGLRTKHLGHDLPPLEKQAPHVPRWMTAWVMSLIVADPDTRPRKATVVRETFLLRDTTRVPVAAPMPVAPELVHPQGLSAPVSLPPQRPVLHATARTIPIAVGPNVGPTQPPRRPLPAAAKSPVSAPVAQVRPKSAAKSKMPLGAIAVIIVVLSLAGWWVLKPAAGSKSSSTGSSSASPRIIDIGTDGLMKGFRDLGSFRQRYYAGEDSAKAPNLPGGEAKPLAYDQLYAWFRPGTGINTFSGSDDDKPGRVTDTVALWHDLGPVSGDNALAVLPWDVGTARRITFQMLKPDAKKLPLPGPRHFVVFGASSSAPEATLGFIGRGQGKAVPFADAASSGATLAVVFYQDASKRPKDSIVAHVNFGDGSVALKTDSEGHAFFAMGHVGAQATAASRVRRIEVSALDATIPTVALATWRTNGAISVHLLNAKGAVADGAVQIPAPAQTLQNIALGGDAYWTYRDAGSAKSPFYGGVAELRLYAAALAESDQQKLIEELRREYFP